MDFQSCIDNAKTLSNLIYSLLTEDDTTTVDNIDSLRKIVKDNVNFTGAAFDSNRYYKKGDIISYNKDIYISLENNNNEQPDTSQKWLIFKVNKIQNSMGFSDTIYFKTDGSLLVSNTIETVEFIETGVFKFYFKEERDNTDYSVFAESEINTQSHTTVADKQTTYFLIKTFDCLNGGLATPDFINIQLGGF
jgi:hypothetical protein